VLQQQKLSVLPCQGLQPQQLAIGSACMAAPAAGSAAPAGGAGGALTSLAAVTNPSILLERMRSWAGLYGARADIYFMGCELAFLLLHLGSLVLVRVQLPGWANWAAGAASAAATAGHQMGIAAAGNPLLSHLHSLWGTKATGPVPQDSAAPMSPEVALPIAYDLGLMAALCLRAVALAGATLARDYVYRSSTVRDTLIVSERVSDALRDLPKLLMKRVPCSVLVWAVCAWRCVATWRERAWGLWTHHVKILFPRPEFG
jgi:hypothetical protein